MEVDKADLAIYARLSIFLLTRNFKCAQEQNKTQVSNIRPEIMIFKVYAGRKVNVILITNLNDLKGSLTAV